MTRHPAARPATLLATVFGCGYLPWVPGSWGSLAALPVAAAIAWAGGPPALAGAGVAVFLLGWWAAGVAAPVLGQEDPGCIVIDEVAGQWLTLVAVPLSLWGYAGGFVLFRVFDMLKPWPVSWADRRLPGGFGIMADDVLAAAYAAALLLIGRHYLGR